MPSNFSRTTILWSVSNKRSTKSSNANWSCGISCGTILCTSSNYPLLEATPSFNSNTRTTLGSPPRPRALLMVHLPTALRVLQEHDLIDLWITIRNQWNPWLSHHRQRPPSRSSLPAIPHTCVLHLLPPLSLLQGIPSQLFPLNIIFPHNQWRLPQRSPRRTTRTCWPELCPPHNCSSPSSRRLLPEDSCSGSSRPVESWVQLQLLPKWWVWVLIFMRFWILTKPKIIPGCDWEWIRYQQQQQRYLHITNSPDCTTSPGLWWKAHSKRIRSGRGEDPKGAPGNATPRGWAEDPEAAESALRFKS